MAAQPGEGATQLGVCVLCGEELDLHEAQLVEVRCNKHKHGCDDQLFHSDCVIDLIDRRAGSRRCVACPGEDSTRPLGLQRCPVPHHRGRAADARLACGSIRVSRTFYLKKSTYFDLAGASLQTTVLAQALGGGLSTSHAPCAHPASTRPATATTGFACPRSMMDGPGPGCDGKIMLSTILHQIKRKKLAAVAPPAAAKVIPKKVSRLAACICACCVVRAPACACLTCMPIRRLNLLLCAAGRVPDRPTQGGVSPSRG